MKGCTKCWEESPTPAQGSNVYTGLHSGVGLVTTLSEYKTGRKCEEEE